jgi:hypothetical protein
MSLKTKRKLDQAENNLFNKLKQGISQHNYQLPKSGTKGVTGSRGGSMYSNVKNGASLYDDPTSIINSGFSPQQGGQSDVLDNAMKTYGGIDIGKSWQGRDRGSGEGRGDTNNKTKTNTGKGILPGAGGNDATDNDAVRTERMIKEGEAKRPDITKESGEGKQVLVEDVGNNVDEALGNITKKDTQKDTRIIQNADAEDGNSLATATIDLGNAFREGKALVRNIKANQKSKVDPLSSNFKPGKLKRQTKRFIKQGVKSNEEFGNDDYRTNLDGLKPIDDANYDPKEGQKGLKPIPRGYMPIKTSLNQQNQENKMQEIASNLTPTSNNFSGQKNDEFNKSQFPKIDKESGESGALNLDAAIKKETKQKNLNDQVKAYKTAIENKKENDELNKRDTRLNKYGQFGESKGSGNNFGADPNAGSITNNTPAKKKNTPNTKGAFNGGMLPGTKSSKKQEIGEKPSGSEDKASGQSIVSVSKQSRKNYLTSGINPNKESTTKNSSINSYKSRQSSGKVEDVNESNKSSKLGVKTRSKVSMSGGRVKNTPVNNNKNKNTKKVKPRKVNPTVNNKFNLEDELASVSSKKGL